jgi:hypothetical protein
VVVPLTEAHPAMFPAERFTIDEVAWAVSVVLSRSYGLATADGTASVLVPMLDMLNHGNVHTRFGVTEDAGIFHIVARDAFSRGQEVRMGARVGSGLGRAERSGRCTRALATRATPTC